MLATLSTETRAAASLHPAWSRMSAIVDEVVQYYRTDFTEHDAAALGSAPTDSPFVWYARPMGTHLFSRAGIARDVGMGWKGFSACVDTVSERGGSGWYRWDGARFKSISQDSARALVTKWERDASPETDEHRSARLARGGW